MTIAELYRIERISFRSFNLCKYAKINNVSDLVNFYNRHKSFLKLRNCGSKSNDELIEICKEYNIIPIGNKELALAFVAPLEIIINNLNRAQREVLNSYIQIETQSLTIRSKNAISYYLKENFNIKNFAEKIILNVSFVTRKLKNIGSKSIMELDNYLINIKDFLLLVSELQQEKHLIALKNKFLIQKRFEKIQIPIEILESESFFGLTNYLILQNRLFDENKTQILIRSLKIYKKTPKLNYDEIAIEVNLSRERVRQISREFRSDLFNNLLFIQNFNEDLTEKLNIDINSNLILISDEIVNSINNTNDIKFTKEFVTFLIYTYLEHSYSLVGGIEDVLFIKYINNKGRYNWNNFYLVKKEIVNQLDFNSLAYDIQKRQSIKIEESYSFNFKSYLTKFLIGDNLETLNIAMPIAEKIVNEEFAIFLDLNENIIFNRTTRKNPFEYAYEALEKLGKPSKVNDIYNKVNELYPNYKTTEGKIRGSMKRANGFLPEGRESIFSLKKWDGELDNYKGGTIRDIAEEFLKQSNNPMHISAISDYILKFRKKSNQTSIWSNLKLDESKTFRFYKGAKIGLLYKKYDIIFKEITPFDIVRKKTWEETYELLINFIKNEERIPASSGTNESEKKLYRWFNIQTRKYYDGKLGKEKEDQIEKLLES